MQLRSRKMALGTMKRFGRAAFLLLAALLVLISMPARPSNSTESPDDGRADAILAKMTLEQRVDHIGSSGAADGRWEFAITCVSPIRGAHCATGTAFFG